MTRIDKTLIVLSRPEAERIGSVVTQKDRAEALRVLRDVIAKKVELVLRRRCK